MDLHENTKLLHQLNCILPNDLKIFRIYSVPPTAHARYDAISRTYLYRITQEKNPFRLEFSLFYSKQLRLDLMNQACNILKEFSDFTSFSKLHTDVITNQCHIFSANWRNYQNEIQFIITADRFLRNMVRAIVGSLLDVGTEKITLQNFHTIIEKKDRSAAGTSIPAKGLHLVEIKYPEGLKLYSDQYTFY